MKVQLLFVLILIISACTEKVEHSFYYADGSQITDSTYIRLVSNEIDSLLKENQNISLKIHSTLLPNDKINCSTILDSMRIKMRTNLIERNPKLKDRIDALSQESILKAGIIIIDNKSRQIVHYLNYGENEDLISNWSLRSHKFYGLALAMDKEFDADDEYVYWEESNVINADGQKDTTKYEMRRTLKWLFSHGPVGPVIRYPYRHYSIVDWKNFDSKLKLNLDFSEYHPKYPTIKSKMLDLTKTFAMINNEGIYKSTSLVNKVIDQEGKDLLKKHTISKQLISNKTLKELEELLSYNMVYGQGQGGFVKKKLSLDDNHTVYFGQSGSNIDWILCSNKTHTIGIITATISHIKAGENINHSLYLGGWNSPRKGMPILRFVLDELNK